MLAIWGEFQQYGFWIFRSWVGKFDPKKKKSYNWRVAVLSSHFLCTHSTLHSAHCSQNWTIKMLIRNNAYSYVRTAIVMYANRCEPLGSQSYVAPLRHCQKNFRLGVRTSMYALGDEGKLTHTFYFSVHTFYYNSIIAGNVKTVRRWGSGAVRPQRQ